MMSKWKVKAALQKTISKLPKREKINFLLEKHIRKNINLDDENFKSELVHVKDHIRYFDQYGHGLEGAVILEMGTDWHPILPIAFYLSGVEKTVTINNGTGFSNKNIIATINKFIEWHQGGKLEDILIHFKEDRMSRIQKLIASDNSKLKPEDLMAEIRMELRTESIKNLDLKESSIGYICSNNSFEHIYKDELKAILSEFKRVLYDEGVMSHFIDTTDYYALIDKNISIYNFLQFDERTWRKVDNKISPQNRMRFKDYKDLYLELKIPFKEDKVNPGYVKDLLKQPIAPEFSKYTPDELAESHGYLISVV